MIDFVKTIAAKAPVVTNTTPMLGPLNPNRLPPISGWSLVDREFQLVRLRVKFLREAPKVLFGVQV
jgi:hypothetical protein